MGLLVRWLFLGLLLFTGQAAGFDQCLELKNGEKFTCLADLEVNNLGNLEFELQLVEAARSVRKYDYASVVLERIVLIHPDQAGARLDLVILSMRAGDNVTAAEHLNYLLALPDPPPLAEKLIRRLDTELQTPVAQATPGLGPDYQLQLSLGYDDNPNLGVEVGAINLIIDGVARPLSPSDSIRPDPKAFVGIAGKFDYSYSDKGRLQGVLDARQYEGTADQDTLASSLQMEHQIAENRYLQVVASDFRMRDGLYLSRIGAGVRQIFGGCNCYGVGGAVDVMEGSERSFRSYRGKINGEVKKVFGPLSLYGYGNLAFHNQPYPLFWQDLTRKKGDLQGQKSKRYPDTQLSNKAVIGI